MRNAPFLPSRLFLWSTGILLLLTGTAKILSAMGTGVILTAREPVFGLTYRAIFWCTAILESGVGASCILARSPLSNCLLVLWLSAGFWSYRVALYFTGFERSCTCFGNLTEAIGLPADVTDGIMIGILCYLTIGSIGMILYLRRRHKKETTIE